MAVVDNLLLWIRGGEAGRTRLVDKAAMVLLTLLLWMLRISPLTSAGRGATRSQHMDYKLIFKLWCLVAELATKWRRECTMGQNQVVL